MRGATGSRLRSLTFWVGLAAGGAPLSGCHRTGGDNAGPNAGQAAAAAAVKQSYADMTKQFNDLQQRFADLGKQVEAIPADLPGYPQLRASFYGAEEARGVTDAKVTLLAGHVDAASASGKPDQLQQVSTEIAKAQDDARQIDQLYLKLLHQALAFQRAADQRTEALAAAAAPPPPHKAKRLRSRR
jgi:hypothetical protein